MQAPRADVFLSFIHRERNLSQTMNGIGLEFQRHLLGREQARVLPRQARIRAGQNPLEIFNGQRAEFHANRKPPLQFRDQIARF